jgi:hypothetical protein
MELHLHSPVGTLIQDVVLTSTQGQSYVYLSLHIPESPHYALTLFAYITEYRMKRSKNGLKVRLSWRRDITLTSLTALRFRTAICE